MGKVVLLVLFMIQAFSWNAQDKLLLLNGVVDRGKLIEETDDMLKFKIYKNGGKEKIILYDKFRVFSHTNMQGVESILYKKDTAMGSFYSENQMRMYIYGERDARGNFNNTHHFLLGGLFGSGVALFDTYVFDNSAPGGSGFFKETPSMVSVVAPFLITIGATLIKSKIRRDQVSDVAYLSSEEYIEGFNKVRRFRKVKGALFGSIAGVAAGLIANQFAGN